MDTFGDGGSCKVMLQWPLVVSHLVSEWVAGRRGSPFLRSSGSSEGISRCPRKVGLPDGSLISTAQTSQPITAKVTGIQWMFGTSPEEGTSQINGMHLRTMVASGPLPKRGKLSVEVSKEVPTLKFPFVVSDLTLLGRPRTQN